MPKNIHKVDRFDGGMNNNFDKKDIGQNEAELYVDLDVSKVGKIRVIGNLKASATGYVAETDIGTMVAGYGFFSYSHDYDMLSSADTFKTPAEVPTDYVVVQDDAKVKIYDITNSVWHASAFTFGSTASPKPVYTVVDGVLRTSDGNFGTNNQNKWFGRIKRTHFSGNASAISNFNGWYSNNTDLTAPTRGLYGDGIGDTASSGGGSTTVLVNSKINTALNGELDDGVYIAHATFGFLQAGTIRSQSGTDQITTATMTGTWSAGAPNQIIYDLHPPVGSGFNLSVKSDNSLTGSIEAGDYEFASSFLYDNIQESKLYNMTGELTVTAGEGLTSKVLATYPYDERITGGRIYIREANTDNPWLLFLDVNMKSGARSSLTADYSAWSESVDGTAPAGEAPRSSYPFANATSLKLNTDTYDTLNGYSPEEVSIDISGVGKGYKTAVITDRKMYIGNVRRVDEDGETLVERDRMYKSFPNKFDTFLLADFVDVNINDGESIVKLEEYADRILQLKQKNVYLINIQQSFEILEDTFKFTGIKHPFQSTKTRHGIAWISANGVYLYTGKDVINLIEKKIDDGTDSYKWGAFFDEDTSFIGYHPKHDILVIGKNNLTGGSLCLFDFNTGSWVYGNGVYSRKHSNFVNGQNNELMVANLSSSATVSFNKWTDSPSSVTASYKSREEDFGAPGIRKKVYKTYVSYIGGTNQSASVYYGVDGSSPTTWLGDLDDTTGSRVIAELSPTSAINDIYSIQLALSGTVASTFEINDYSIVYRGKQVK